MEVKYISHMGDDLQVVNAARVSFGKESEWDRKLDHYSENNNITQWEEEGWEFENESTSGDIFRRLSKADQGLIGFLARGCTTGEWEGILRKSADAPTLHWEDPEQDDLSDLEDLLNHIKKMPDHWTPFGHTAITLHIKAPLFVARQLGKHQVGFVWNEVSRRYITDTPEFYVPETWRKAAENVKQGSSDEVVEGIEYRPEGAHLKDYITLLESGVCPEQARMVLPQSMYTEWIWTGNLYGFANVYNQRTDPHAQKEVRDVAHQIGEIIEPLFPVSWKALTK